MKLIIQIPCLNEAETLPLTYGELPKQLPGIDTIEVMVIDDGSTDRTSEVAHEIGVNHVVRLAHNTGLANAFASGLEAALLLGADIVVNTDADNQYQAGCIADLIKPIVEDGYDFVIGVRDFEAIKEFSFLKRLLQRLGSRVVQQLSGVKTADATSGFRAFNRKALLRLNVLSNFSYTLETIIQAKRIGLFITTVPIQTNASTRPSRLFRSIPEFVYKSVVTMMRAYLRYEPLRAFVMLSVGPFVMSAIIWLRFFYFYFSDLRTPTGHTQSLIFGTAFLLVGLFTFMMGLIGDLLKTNRQLLENILVQQRRSMIGSIDPIDEK